MLGIKKICLKSVKSLEESFQICLGYNTHGSEATKNIDCDHKASWLDYIVAVN